MTDSTLIADLIRGGVDPDLVQRVATAIIEAQSSARAVLVPDEAAERRRAADRARKAANKAPQEETFRRIPQNSTVSAETPLPPSPPPPQTPPPPHPPTPACTPAREEPQADALTLTGEPPPKRKDRCTRGEVEAYAQSIGLPASDGAYMHLHWTQNGWRAGRVALKCWRSAIEKWKRDGILPSQKQRPVGRPQRQAYDPRNATAGLTAEQIGGKF